MNFTEKLIKAAADNRLERYIDKEKAKIYEKMYHFLVDYNEKVNLTAITDEDGFIYKHIIDSLTVVPLINNGDTVLDVGSGAGFPAIPIAISLTDVHVTALDSTGKKCDFIRAVAEECGITNLKAVCGRAEELAFGEMREEFDIVTARAVAELPVLSELCLPFVKVKGCFLSMKAKCDIVPSKLHELGGEIAGVREIELNTPEERLQRSIYVIKKITKTPETYPRKYSKIKSSPIK